MVIEALALCFHLACFQVRGLGLRAWSRGLGLSTYWVLASFG